MSREGGKTRRDKVKGRESWKKWETNLQKNMSGEDKEDGGVRLRKKRNNQEMLIRERIRVEKTANMLYSLSLSYMEGSIVCLGKKRLLKNIDMNSPLCQYWTTTIPNHNTNTRDKMYRSSRHGFL